MPTIININGLRAESMAEVGKPTHITLEQDADVVIHKGANTVELRADGSIYIDGRKVAEGNANDNAPAVVETTPAPEQGNSSEAPAAPQPAAKIDEEALAKRRQEMIQKFLQEEGMDPMEAIEKVQNILQQETMQRDAGTTPSTPAAPPVAEQSPAPEQSQPQTQPQTQPEIQVDPANMQVGQFVKGEGIFIGIWQMHDEKGRGLSKIFNAFADTEDLMDDKDEKLMLTFNELVEHVPTIKDRHGHAGGGYATEEALRKALWKDTYKGEWVIPPVEMMAAVNAKGEAGKSGILILARNSGDLTGTFEKVKGVAASQMYWTCTETPTDPDYVYYADLSDDRGARKLIDYIGRDYNKLATRLVRLVPRA